MTDQSQPTVDTSGITRTTDGQIAQDQKTTDSPDQSSQSTNQGSQDQSTTQTKTSSTTADGKTLLTEGKTDDKAEPTDKAKTETKETKAPEKYADYKVPEGFKLDDKVKAEADTLFKGLGLNQEQAQSLIDLYTSKASEASQEPYKAYQKLTDEWRTAAMDHPDLRGKLGPGQEVNVRIAKALDSLGDPKLASDFKELMDLTGAGNNQAFIRVIDKFAQKITEGTHVAGNGPTKEGQSAPGQAKPSAASALWPNLPSSQAGR